MRVLRPPRRTVDRRRAPGRAGAGRAGLGLTLTRPPGLLALLSVVLLLGTAGCGAGRKVGTIQTTPSAIASATGGRPAHIAILLLENEEYRDVIGSSAAPFLNRLVRTSALASGMYAVTHPSLPNYLALTGGSTFGIDSDCDDCSLHATSLVDQLSAAHLPWKGYMESLPDGCASHDTDLYVRKHDPFFSYLHVRERPSLCTRVVSFRQLDLDERAGALPAFAWITPNLCDDMHSCSVAHGDAFLARLVPRLLRALGPRGLLIVTWDEGTSDDGCCRLASGGHIAGILAGGLARPGARMTSPADSYSILQLVEDLLGLPRLRAAACPCTPSLQPLLRDS